MVQKSSINPCKNTKIDMGMGYKDYENVQSKGTPKISRYAGAGYRTHTLCETLIISPFM
jgi:hypothetical protein